MKHLMIAALMSAFTMNSFAQSPTPTAPPVAPTPPQGKTGAATPKGKGPGLTDTQRKCLEEQLGKPGQGAPPTKEKFQDAFKTCNITPPAHKGPPPGGMRGTPRGAKTQGTTPAPTEAPAH